MPTHYYMYDLRFALAKEAEANTETWRSYKAMNSNDKEIIGSEALHLANTVKGLSVSNALELLLKLGRHIAVSSLLEENITLRKEVKRLKLMLHKQEEDTAQAVMEVENV